MKRMGDKIKQIYHLNDIGVCVLPLPFRIVLPEKRGGDHGRVPETPSYGCT